MWECVVCHKHILSEEIFLKHCGKMVMWENGIEGKGIDMESKIVKVQVSGWIELSQENLERLLAYENQHMGIVYALHMGYVDTEHLEFEIP